MLIRNWNSPANFPLAQLRGAWNSSVSSPRALLTAFTFKLARFARLRWLLWAAVSR